MDLLKRKGEREEIRLLVIKDILLIFSKLFCFFWMYFLTFSNRQLRQIDRGIREQKETNVEINKQNKDYIAQESKRKTGSLEFFRYL